MMIIEIIGWILVLILPTASAVQLFKIVKSKRTEGISAFAWFLYALANFGTYIFAEKLLSIQAILAFLLTGFLNLIIVGLTLVYNKRRKR